MANADLRILYKNALPQYTGVVTKFIQVPQKVISNNVFYNHRMSFNNEDHSTYTTISKYVWEAKMKLKIMPSLKWYIIKSLPAYSNISKKFQLCLQENFEILNYPNSNELLSKSSEPFSKCHHVNKFLLSNYQSNDQTFWKMSQQKYIMTFQLLSKKQHNLGNCQLIVK